MNQDLLAYLRETIGNRDVTLHRYHPRKQGVSSIIEQIATLPDGNPEDNHENDHEGEYDYFGQRSRPRGPAASPIRLLPPLPQLPSHPLMAPYSPAKDLGSVTGSAAKTLLPDVVMALAGPDEGSGETEPCKVGLSSRIGTDLFLPMIDFRDAFVSEYKWHLDFLADRKTGWGSMLLIGTQHGAHAYGKTLHPEAKFHDWIADLMISQDRSVSTDQLVSRQIQRAIDMVWVAFCLRQGEMCLRLTGDDLVHSFQHQFPPTPL